MVILPQLCVVVLLGMVIATVTNVLLPSDHWLRRVTAHRQAQSKVQSGVKIAMQDPLDQLPSSTMKQKNAAAGRLPPD
jgi:hypothetical protein